MSTTPKKKSSTSTKKEKQKSTLNKLLSCSFRIYEAGKETRVDAVEKEAARRVEVIYADAGSVIPKDLSKDSYNRNRAYACAKEPDAAYFLGAEVLMCSAGVAMPEPGMGLTTPLSGTGILISSGEPGMISGARPGMWMRLAMFW